MRLATSLARLASRYPTKSTLAATSVSLARVPQQSHGRQLSMTATSRADMDANILATADGSMPSLVQSYSHKGFVVSAHRVRGPVALLPQNMLQWKVKDVEDITPESLAVFTVCKPAIEILVIGTGTTSKPIPEETLKFLKEHNILVEASGTLNAISAYNFLSEENRQVGAALLVIDE